MTELWEHSKDKFVKKGKTTDDEIKNRNKDQKPKTLEKSTDDDDGTREGTIVGNRRLASGQAANLFSHPSSSYFSTPQRQWTDLYPFYWAPLGGARVYELSFTSTILQILLCSQQNDPHFMLLNSVQTIFIRIYKLYPVNNYIDL